MRNSEVNICMKYCPIEMQKKAGYNESYAQAILVKLYMLYRHVVLYHVKILPKGFCESS